ncbi:hypothetical protein SAMN05421869_13917 [Nonomuraea jiangxiensis]|uniref:PD-(D/E)XK nuclease superfamily protein n=2 Tax=Nonomuraea jiangxiensis TaxID=633440 RepID=A0A1G9RQ14_9ACTN|nr:hypothetical protein SAMN05421869_13917 [Nonomuraea jiangxiensis]
MMEDPLHLLGRLRLGREEYCQRLLTMLIVGGPYPPWNSRSRPSPRGAWFLRSLDELSFGQSGWRTQPLFVDEFELRPRHDDEQGGAPDYAVLWADRLWMIELKTETSSHRRDQLTAYYALADHHHPGLGVDLTYLTPPFTFTPPAGQDCIRFAHVTWTQIFPLLRAVWGKGTDREQQVLTTLLQALESIGSNWSNWRAQRVGTTRDEPPTIEDMAMALAEATARDGQQRAVDYPTADLDLLQRLRMALRQTICTKPEQSPLRHVKAWLWNAATSGGTALSSSGRDVGFELRLSWYRKPAC